MCLCSFGIRWTPSTSISHAGQEVGSTTHSKRLYPHDLAGTIVLLNRIYISIYYIPGRIHIQRDISRVFAVARRGLNRSRSCIYPSLGVLTWWSSGGVVHAAKEPPFR